MLGMMSGRGGVGTLLPHHSSCIARLQPFAVGEGIGRKLKICVLFLAKRKVLVQCVSIGLRSGREKSTKTSYLKFILFKCVCAFYLWIAGL